MTYPSKMKRVVVSSLLVAVSGCQCGEQVNPIIDGGVADSGVPVFEGEGEGVGEGEGEGDVGEGEGEGEGEDIGVIRFVAVGDAGHGNDEQYAVGDAMTEACAEAGGCGFALLLGDNIYDSGVDGVDDPQWQEKFELPFASCPFPFYGTLGNHDYGVPPVLDFLGLGAGIGLDPAAGVSQVTYSGVSEKFVMPDTHYMFVEGPVQFVSLNTTSLFWRDLSSIERSTGFDDENARQLESLSTWSTQNTSPWRIAFGHHPYLSNGPHGNAGSYDGVFIDGLVGSGTGLRDFFDEHVIGQFDVYVCGHDHDLQDVGEVNGTDLVVSGAGSGVTDFRGDNDVEFGAENIGFFIFEVSATQIDLKAITVRDPGDTTTPDPWTIAHTRTITH